MGGVMWIGLVAENSVCREVLGFGVGGAGGMGVVLVGWGAGAGLVGSMVSILSLTGGLSCCGPCGEDRGFR